MPVIRIRALAALAVALCLAAKARLFQENAAAPHGPPAKMNRSFTLPRIPQRSECRARPKPVGFDGFVGSTLG